MLYREPKLLKLLPSGLALQRYVEVSVLSREPNLLKHDAEVGAVFGLGVSVLYREPKLLKPTSIHHQ